MLGPAGWDDPVVELVAVGEPGDPVVEGVEVVCLFGLVEDGQAGGIRGEAVEQASRRPGRSQDGVFLVVSGRGSCDAPGRVGGEVGGGGAGEACARLVGAGRARGAFGGEIGVGGDDREVVPVEGLGGPSGW